MSALPVDISTSTDATVVLVVDEVDFELRLVEDVGQGQALIFDASKGQLGRQCTLLPRAKYVLRYNNNDGGAGVLHFRILERGTQEISRREVRLGAISTPIVIEFEITLHRNPELAAA